MTTKTSGEAKVVGRLIQAPSIRDVCSLYFSASAGRQLYV